MKWLAWLAATWIAHPPPGTVSALAQRGGSLYAGTDVGLFRADATGWERAPFPGAVLSMADSSEGLWVATPSLLWLWDGVGEPRSVSLGVGARLRCVEVDGEGQVWAASESGLFVRRPGSASFERDATLPPGDVLAVRAVGSSLFAARNASLWRRSRDRFEQLEAGLGEGWWELRAAAALGDSLWLAVPRGLWRVGPAGAHRIDPALGELRDLHARSGELVAASARGVFGLVLGADGSLRASPRLDAGAEQLLAVGEQTWVATDRGVARLEMPSTPAPAPPARGTAPTAAAPAIAVVHAAALAYLDLAPSGLRRAEARARHRGWLPQLRAGLGSGRDRDRDRDWDEVLSSGSVLSLLDRHEGSDRGVRADLELVWELDRLAAPDDAIAVSRERRLVIELRDQVLERVNRIYFERLRVLDAASIEADPAKRRELELRVAELGAQLDAWTGGRFSRLLADSPPIDRSGP